MMGHTIDGYSLESFEVKKSMRVLVTSWIFLHDILQIASYGFLDGLIVFHDVTKDIKPWKLVHRGRLNNWAQNESQTFLKSFMG